MAVKYAPLNFTPSVEARLNIARTKLNALKAQERALPREFRLGITDLREKLRLDKRLGRAERTATGKIWDTLAEEDLQIVEGRLPQYENAIKAAQRGITTVQSGAAARDAALQKDLEAYAQKVLDKQLQKIKDEAQAREEKYKKDLQEAMEKAKQAGDIVSQQRYQQQWEQVVPPTKAEETPWLTYAAIGIGVIGAFGLIYAATRSK